MRKMILGLVAAGVAIPTMSTPADAQRYGDRYYGGDRYERSYQDSRYYDRGRGYNRYYDGRGHYSGPTWRGRDGRYYCHRSDGTTGLIVGGAAGALIGREVAGRGDRTAGTIIGGILGGLIGSAVDQDGGRRCR